MDRVQVCTQRKAMQTKQVFDRTVIEQYKVYAQLQVRRQDG